MKSSNGKFICADGSRNNLLFANRDSAKGWETFSLIMFAKNKCSIRAYNGKYLCAELNSRGEITATREKVGPWEIFSMIEFDSNYVAFKAANGKFLCMDESGSPAGQIIAKSDSIGVKEKFLLIESK